MDVNFESKKTVLSNNIDVKYGSFALDSASLKFETCRERFAVQWTNEVGWFLKHPPNKGKDVASFLLKTEAVLKQVENSKFSDTNRDTILWIEPSIFWKKCRIRRSLLTILVRAGMVYDLNKDNYEEALFNQEYVFSTKRAVQRFLYGFTNYVGPLEDISGTLDRRGWKTVFEGKSSDDIKTMLVSSEGSYSPVFQGKDALWC